MEPNGPEIIGSDKKTMKITQARFWPLGSGAHAVTSAGSPRIARSRANVIVSYLDIMAARSNVIVFDSIHLDFSIIII
jgi:hypothetical protein